MNWNRLKCITPGATVLSLADAKDQVQYEDTDQDMRIANLIRAAQATVEGPRGIGVALLTQQWRMSLDCWPQRIDLPLGPVQSVQSITYTDLTGTTQTLDPATYVTDFDSDPARIGRKPNTTWPTASRQPGSIKISFTAGFGDTADLVPDGLKHAMQLTVAHWFRNREGVVGVDNRDSSTILPVGISELLDAYRCGWAA